MIYSSLMKDVLAGLNERQREAARTTEGPLLIVAGAGTGKTKTLTARMGYLIEQGTPADKILGITFTNKAAKEMRERIRNLLGDPWAKAPLLKTFHALGVQILREFHKEMNLPKHFAILDTDDVSKMIKEAMQRVGVDPKQNDPKIVRSVISREKGAGRTHTSFQAQSGSARTDIIASVWNAYETLKRESKGLDFDDLLLETLELLRRNPHVRETLQNRWQYVHVDEYQDTNQVQEEMIDIIAQKHGNICAVGDTDQTIYSWRGANVRTMLSFEKRHPGAQVVLLEENYRSTKTILLAADAVIQKNSARFDKVLHTNNDGGDLITCLAAVTEMDEAYHVARQSEKLISAGVGAGEIAVLYRTNFQSRALEEAMLRTGVAYHVVGTKFFERREIKDALAYLRAALDRENLTSMKRIINEPKRGLGPAAIAAIFSGMSEKLSVKQNQTYQEFLKFLDQAEEHARTEPLADTLRFIIEKSGMGEAFRTGSSEDKERMLNLEELVTFATRYDGPIEETLEQFLDDTALRSDQDDMEEKNEGVHLMTVHASKGLEFKYVFIVGLEQGLFPSTRMSRDARDDSEEERRLFYVAITRAKEKLFLSYAHLRTIYGEQTANSPSLFLSDIPVTLIEHGEAGGHEKPQRIVYLDF